MPFQFVCPHCGAKSKTSETAIGKTGPCYQCREEVVIFPPSAITQPPKVVPVTILGAVTAGAFVMLTMLSARSIPTFVALSRTGSLQRSEVVAELTSVLTFSAISALVGGLLFLACAGLTNTRGAFFVFWRGIWLGTLLGGAVGAAVAIWVVDPGSLPTFIASGRIAATFCFGAVLGAMMGALAAFPFVISSEKQLVQKSIFIAPKVPAPDTRRDPDQPATPGAAFEATVVEADGVATTARQQEYGDEELTRERRQELIRRLGGEQE